MVRLQTAWQTANISGRQRTKTHMRMVCGRFVIVMWTFPDDLSFTLKAHFICFHRRLLNCAFPRRLRKQIVPKMDRNVESHLPFPSHLTSSPQQHSYFSASLVSSLLLEPEQQAQPAVHTVDHHSQPSSHFHKHQLLLLNLTLDPPKSPHSFTASPSVKHFFRGKLYKLEHKSRSPSFLLILAVIKHFHFCLQRKSQILQSEIQTAS